MEMLSKKHAAWRGLPPHRYFHVQCGVRGGAVFFESEPINVSAHLVYRSYRTPDRDGVFEHMRQREIAHEYVCQHVSGRADPFMVG